MAKIDLEHHILTLWTTTRLPIDVVTLRMTSGASKAEIQKALDQLTVDNTLDMNTDDHGNLSWSVVGTARAKSGPETLEQWHMLDRVRKDVATSNRGSSSSTALQLGGGEGKSIVLSSALSFFFGGFGLFYAAPIPVAVGAVLAQVVLGAILPHSLFAWLLGGLLPLNAIVGGAYAWAHNKFGRRTALREAVGGTKLLPPRSGR